MNEEAAPTAAATALEEAECLIKAGDYASARAMCEKLIAESPADADALAALGRIAMLQYRWPDAIRLFDQALCARTDPVTLANLGNCYWKTGELDQAEYCLRGALALEPGFNIARTGIATLHHAWGRFAEALAELDAVLQEAPVDHQAQTRRGCTLARLERYDEAQAAFSKAVADAGHFIYPRLVSFDADMWALVSGPARALAPPQTAFAVGSAADADYVSLISCNPPYVRRFGLPFLRSFADHAPDRGLLHLHVYDPDDAIIDEVRNEVVRSRLKRFVLTTEQSPFPATRPLQRRAWYACGRLVHMNRWLTQYARPILCLDVDFIVEGGLSGLVAKAKGMDVALNPRVPIDSPWLDIIANIIVANPTPAAIAYFSAVSNYALATLEREPDSWLVDQTAMYCVLAMMRRFAREPAIAWLAPDAAEGLLWHIGHAYEHLLDDPRYRKYATASA